MFAPTQLTPLSPLTPQTLPSHSPLATGGSYMNEIGLRALALTHGKSIVVIDARFPLLATLYPAPPTKTRLIDPNNARTSKAIYTANHRTPPRGDRPQAPDVAFDKDTVIIVGDGTHFYCTYLVERLQHNALALRQAFEARGGDVHCYEAPQ
jgi:hypothetical protein